VFPGVRGETSSVEVDDPEGIQPDNVRYAVLEGATRPAVLVVTSGGELSREAFYLQQALVAQGGEGASYDVQGVAGAQLSSWDLDRLGRHAAVVAASIGAGASCWPHS
jgi:hypothetical protein